MALAGRRNAKISLREKSDSSNDAMVLHAFTSRAKIVLPFFGIRCYHRPRLALAKEALRDRHEAWRGMRWTYRRA